MPKVHDLALNESPQHTMDETEVQAVQEERRNLQTSKAVLYKSHSIGRTLSYCIPLKPTEFVYKANTGYIFMQHIMSWLRLQEQALQYPKPR